ncbi:P-loop containing nucleoside triphosphate hydrolase protein [Peziza echinospora]|nr:P-loop containing nucleoside triphosphate hydrolase protein [Peziza echinospora]
MSDMSLSVSPAGDAASQARPRHEDSDSLPVSQSQLEKDGNVGDESNEASAPPVNGYDTEASDDSCIHKIVKLTVPDESVSQASLRSRHVSAKHLNHDHKPPIQPDPLLLHNRGRQPVSISSDRGGVHDTGMHNGAEASRSNSVSSSRSLSSPSPYGFPSAASSSKTSLSSNSPPSTRPSSPKRSTGASLQNDEPSFSEDPDQPSDDVGGSHTGPSSPLDTAAPTTPDPQLSCTTTADGVSAHDHGTHIDDNSSTSGEADVPLDPVKVTHSGDSDVDAKPNVVDEFEPTNAAPVKKVTFAAADDLSSRETHYDDKPLTSREISDEGREESTKSPDSDIFQTFGEEFDGLFRGPEDRISKPFVERLSEATNLWNWQKSIYDTGGNSEIDKLMELKGIEKVKLQILAINSKVQICKEQNKNLSRERFNIVFQGNPGTGKTTVARIYAQYLRKVGVLKDYNEFRETTGAALAYGGVNVVKALITDMIPDGYDNRSGVLFIDEAYQLTEEHSPIGGRQVLDYLLTEMENKIGRLVVIFVGYNKEMEKFFEHNPGLSSRIPYSLQFEDFDDFQLLEILKGCIEKEYSPSKMWIEDGDNGLYMRVAIRRLAHGRGARGFGNARAVQNLLAIISERQARRLAKRQRGNGTIKLEKTEYLKFTKEDLIGPDPSDAINHSRAWQQLKELVGLKSVKDTAAGMLGMIRANYLRELAEEKPLSFTLNRVFIGAPGTGKTTVAALYGQILADLGLLSKGEVVLKNPSDFIGACLGKSEARTRAILASTVGKVLVIDEGYMLYSGGPDKQGDSYKTAVIDTLVAEVQGVPGDDRCVLMLGYEDKLREMFDNVNPGLSRRFAMEDAFKFENFTLPQLRKILHYKLKAHDLKATSEAEKVAMDILERASLRPNYSNGGDVENCLDKAKLNYLRRQLKKPREEQSYKALLEPVDFDVDFNRMEAADERVRKALKGRVSSDIISQLIRYQQIAKNAKTQDRKKSSQTKDKNKSSRQFIPTNFVFRGPPGTGKTIVAREMGQLFYDIGLLSSPEVIECSASDFIGQFVGHTAPKTKRQLDKGIGKVLFIDQAYQFLQQGEYARDALNEIENLLPQPRYHKKMVVILAGYELDMQQLMSDAGSPALSSLFPDHIFFRKLTVEECMAILHRELAKEGIQMSCLKPRTSKKEPSPDQDKQQAEFRSVKRSFSMLTNLMNWGNGRDVKSLAEQLSRVHLTLKDGGLSTEDILKCLEEMFIQKHPNNLGASRKTDNLTQNPAQVKGKGVGQGRQTRARKSAAQSCSDRVDVDHDASNGTCSPIATQIDREQSSIRTHVHGLGKFQKFLRVDSFRALSITSKDKPQGVQGVEQRKLEEEERRTKRETQLKKLRACPANYEWADLGGGAYRCLGGSHFCTLDDNGNPIISTTGCE